MGMRSALFLFFCLTLAAQDRTHGLDKEAALGRQMAEEVSRSSMPAEPQAVQDYVAQLGARLTAWLPNRYFPYTFSVVITDRTNALHEPIVLPGGYVFIPVSLLLTATHEAELAGMLAQAIARGPRLVKSDSGTIPIYFASGLSLEGLEALIPADAPTRWRGIELQADASAAAAMSRAGFDPAALLRYLERVQPLDRPRSPFPPRAARIRALQEAIRNLPPAAYTESDEFYRIREHLRPTPEAPSKSQPIPSLLNKL
jgi:predicted Zn-dependent protease